MPPADLEAAAVALLCLTLLSLLADGRLQKFAIYQSSAECLGGQLWSNLSSADFEIISVQTATRAEAVVAAAAAAGGFPQLTLVHIDWSSDCSATVAAGPASVSVLFGYADVSFTAATNELRCLAENRLLAAALRFLPTAATLAISDGCPVEASSSSSDSAHLSRDATDYAELLTGLLTDRRRAGTRQFIISWPVNLTAEGFKSLLSAGWNETWVLLMPSAGSPVANMDAFSRSALSSWRTRVYLVVLEPSSKADAVRRILARIAAQEWQNGTTRSEFEASAAVYSGVGPTKLATYAPNGSVVMETGPKNRSEDSSQETQRLTVVFIQNPPFSFFSDGRVRGICVDILDLLAPLLNLSFNFHALENGTWESAVHLLANRSADLASCDLSVTWQRAQLVDFSLPWTLEFKGAVIPMLKPDLDLFRLFRPFDPWTYLVTTLAILVGGSLLAWLAWLSPISMWNLHALHVQWIPSLAYKDEVSAKQNAWNLFGALLHQGQDFYPNSASSRTLIFFWWTVSLILVSTYTAAMVASLTVPQKASPPQTLPEMLGLGYEFLVPAGGSTQQLFDSAPSGSAMAAIRDSGRLQLIGAGSEPYGLLADGSQRRVAFVTDRTKLSADTKDKCSSLLLTSVAFSPATLAFGVARDAIWLERFNRALQLLLENGIVERLRQRYWTPSVICKAGQPDTLDLEHAAGIFLLFLVFCAIGAVTLIAELVTSACGWSTCSRALSASGKPHLACLTGLARATRARRLGWQRRAAAQPDSQLQQQQQLPEEFRNIRWRPEGIREIEAPPVVLITDCGSSTA